MQAAREQIFSRCWAATRGPIWVCSSNGLPTRTCENVLALASAMALCRVRGTMIRVNDEHASPDGKHSALTSVCAAVPRSISSRITAADLSPSSSVHRAIRSPQTDAIRRPAAVDW
jgi:hypothetical protein